MEHILATVKPGSSMGFSTVDPLMTNVNRIEYSNEILNSSGQLKRQDTFLSRATRMLQGEPADEADSDDNAEKETRTTVKKKNPTVNSPARSDASAEILSTAAATLVEGAIPVREIPNQLLSEPASMCPSEVR